MNMTRRDMARLMGAGALLSRFPSPAQAQNQADRIRYCIVGLGRISMQHFMPGVKQSQHSEVTALVSGHRQKADKMAAEYNVPARSIYSYDNYDEIAHNQDIDAVYIALPNSMHAEYTIRAAKAGKHVLCEKPMATTVADSEAMIGACNRAGKKLMIAYRCQYEPTNLRAIKTIRDGSIGKVQSIESANGFNIHPGEWRLNRKLAGGGPLMDVGIYSLNACRYLTGEEPAHVEGYSSVIDHDGRFNEVEENVSWTMRFPSGILASCITTYGANMDGFYRVYGSKGAIELQPAFSYTGLRFKSQIQGQSPVDEPADDPEPRQFTREADYFADCILHNHEPKSNGQEGLRDMKWMAAIYQSAGLKEG